jgi:hypothetical protein
MNRVITDIVITDIVITDKGITDTAIADMVVMTRCLLHAVDASLMRHR